jgi:hypothetical protein
MEAKKELTLQLSEIKYKYGKDRRAIEKELNYSPNYIDQIISKGGSGKFLEKLKEYANRLAEMDEENKAEEAPKSYRATTKLTQDSLWYQIPQYWDCDYVTYAVGAHMQPLIQNNALVGGKRLDDLSFLVFGEVYILRAFNGMETIRYVFPDPTNSQGLLLLGSKDNSPKTLITYSSLHQVFKARFVINPL